MQTVETAALRRGLCGRSKEEVAAKPLHTRRERLAFVSALFVTAGSLLIHGENVAVTMATRNASLLGSLRGAIESLTGKTCRIESKAGHNTEIAVHGALKLLLECKVLTATADGIGICDGIGEAYTTDASAAAAYVRGAYLGAGSLSVARYHLEFAFTRASIAADFAKLLEKFDIAAKLASRGERTVVYLKDSDAISDTLALMGAGKSVLDFNAVVVERQMSGQTNRRLNCDLHNIDRQVEASMRQCAQLREIDTALLSPPLVETLRARLQNPDFTYEQLASVLGITKSGLKNRLRRLTEIHEKTHMRRGAQDKKEGNDMILGEATVTRVYGHAEAQKLVAHCMRYDSEITMELGTKKINGKSLMGVISMALKPGDTVTIIAKGDDQEQATADIVRILAQ